LNFFGYYVLNLEPTILAFIGQMHPPPEWLQPVAVLEHIPWWHGWLGKMIGRKAQQIMFSLKGIEHHLMVHARDEEALRQKCRVRGAFISQNVYVRDDVYRPFPCDKIYDAVYVAQMKSFKRHHLAANVPQLYVATAWGGDLPAFCQDVGHATFNEKRLDKTELAVVVNQACCSLALSAEEGAMLASFESLLCGVPVVSTPSKGGRDEFFDEENCIIVPPDAAAVAAAVERWKQHPPAPQPIRASALQRQEAHRRKLCEYVAMLIRRHGGGMVAPERLHTRYFGRPGGIGSRFIWADTFDRPEQLERVQNA